MSLLGFIGKVATGFLAGGPVGAIAGAASTLIKPSTAAKVAARPASVPMVNVTSVAPAASRFSSPQVGVLPQFPDSSRTSGVALGPLKIGTTTNYYPTAAGGGGGGVACPAGHHLNKTGYFTKHGFVAKGTVCVKNRRRNPLNPRALSRSMSRIHSAKKAAHFLDRIHIGPCRTRKAKA